MCKDTRLSSAAQKHHRHMDSDLGEFSDSVFRPAVLSLQSCGRHGLCARSYAYDWLLWDSVLRVFIWPLE